MEKISSYSGDKLTLVQTSVFKREYKLKSSDDVIAKLDYPRYFSSDAIAEFPDEKFEIKQPSIWRSEIHILRPGQSYPFAKYEANFWRTRGVLSLSRGEKLNFIFGMFKKTCEISTASGELLVVFANSFSFKEKNIVEIQKHSDILDENPWIIFLGWYIVLQHRRNAAVV
jgi:hypothetical protein